ncbi:MAG: hypothetical protein AB7O59_16935 [Pirellulales bacterium]
MHHDKLPSFSRVARLAIALAILFSLAGCTRLRYRLAADKEVGYLVKQKSNDPRWDAPNYTIGMDPRSRYFDPTDPDNPPIPYDDPASHRYMHCVAGKKGWPCWHMGGNWYYLENPRWKELLRGYNEMTDDGAVKLTMNGAVCLAQVHNTDYRDAIEVIYLSALDVSTERFRFDVQFFGNSDLVFTHLGQERAGGAESNTLFLGTDAPDTSLRLQKQFSAGGELIVGFANNIVWQFAGPDTNFTTSLLNMSFIQPLLRGGGRALIMERLTIVERALLANLRQFERFRQGFYTAMTVGNGNAGAVQPPQRRGGFFGGTGLTGFTGQGAGGQGGVGAGQFGINTGGFGGGGTGGAGAGFVGGGAGGTGGFVGLLQQLQTVRNAQANLNFQLRTLGLLEANLDAGLIDIVQVDQFRQNIETARANLLTQQVTYEAQLDTYKVQNLSFPPDVKVEIDDDMLRQFEFVDPKSTEVLQLVQDFINVVGELPAEPSPVDLKNALDVLERLRSQVADLFASGHADLKALDGKVPERKERMSKSQQAVFDEDLAKLAQSLEDAENRFKQTEPALASMRDRLGTESPGQLTDEVVALSTGMSGLIQELLLIKARARLESITVPRVQLDDQRALDIARGNRLDWMNNRAALVDQWRLIAFNANALKPGLDVFFSGDLGTVGNNPVAFNGQNGSLRVGLRFDAPFTRRLERNDYRSVLIQYQFQRRQLYQYQDGVNFILRGLLRTLNQLEVNLEIQRRAMVIAIRRVDKTREDLNEPPAPTLPGEPVQLLGPTVAQNLIFALNDLLASQNVFMSVVLNHYENRTLLYRELGIMELDDCGIWIDKPINAAEWLTEEECPMPPAVPAEWMKEAGVNGTDLEEFATRQAEAEEAKAGAPQTDKNAPEGVEAGATDEAAAGEAAAETEADASSPEPVEPPRELNMSQDRARREAARRRPTSAQEAAVAPEHRLSRLAMKTAEREKESRQPVSRLLIADQAALDATHTTVESFEDAQVSDMPLPTQPRHSAAPARSKPALRR